MLAVRDRAPSLDGGGLQARQDALGWCPRVERDVGLRMVVEDIRRRLERTGVETLGEVGQKVA